MEKGSLSTPYPGRKETLCIFVLFSNILTVIFFWIVHSLLMHFGSIIRFRSLPRLEEKATQMNPVHWQWGSVVILPSSKALWRSCPWPAKLCQKETSILNCWNRLVENWILSWPCCSLSGLSLALDACLFCLMTPAVWGKKSWKNNTWSPLSLIIRFLWERMTRFDNLETEKLPILDGYRGCFAIGRQ